MGVVSNIISVFFFFTIFQKYDITNSNHIYYQCFILPDLAVELFILRDAVSIWNFTKLLDATELKK